MAFFAFCFFLAAINSSYYETTPCESAFTSNVCSIQSLTEIQDVLLGSNDDTLLVFDIDEVLITTTDSFLKPELELTFMGLVKQAMQEAKTQEERVVIEEKLSVSLTDTLRVLVEANSVTLITQLQAAGKKVIALTSHPTGKFGHIDDVAKWKVNSTKSFGFHFEKFLPQIPNQVLTSLCAKDMPSPLYEDGVLFSRGYSKGQVLLAFLATIDGWRPKRIIFIDDLLKNHEAVFAALQQANIAFIGYHYKKAHLQPHEIDKELVAYQFSYLMKHGCWLRDSEAKKKFGKSNGMEH